MPIDSRQFRNALGAFATGVTIVTTQDAAGKDCGMTVNSFSSVSLEPPMVLWSLAKNAQSRDAFLEASHFGVHILAADQTDLSNRFATRGCDKFADVVLERGHAQLPLLGGCTARFECKKVFRYEGGDHDILVGEVVSFEKFDRPPLVFVAGRYATAQEQAVPASGTSVEEGISNETSMQILLGRAMFQCQLRVRPEFARSGLTELQGIVLFCVARYMPATLAELTRLVGLSGRRLTPSDVDKLIARGLLVTHTVDNAGDAEGWSVTPAGQAILAKIAALNRAVEDEALQGMGDDEVHAFKATLRKVIQRTAPAWHKPL